MHPIRITPGSSSLISVSGGSSKGLDEQIDEKGSGSLVGLRDTIIILIFFNVNSARKRPNLRLSPIGFLNYTLVNK